MVTETEHRGEALVSGTLPNVAGYRYTESHGDGYLYLTVTGLGETVNLDALAVTVGTTTYSGNKLAVGSVDNELRVYLSAEQSSESAIAGLQITVIESYTALDHTWQEIHDAGFAVLHNSNAIFVSSGIYGEPGYYGVEFYMCYDDGQGSVGIDTIHFSTSSADGYPRRADDDM